MQTSLKYGYKYRPLLDGSLTGMVFMLRGLMIVIAIAVAVSLTQAAPSAPVHKKRDAAKHWHDYRFLPGYRPPEVIARERAAHYYRVYGPQ